MTEHPYLFGSTIVALVFLTCSLISVCFFNKEPTKELHLLFIICNLVVVSALVAVYVLYYYIEQREYMMWRMKRRIHLRNRVNSTVEDF